MPAPDETGARRRQGRYVLGDLLGRGGMAEVFSGRAMGFGGFQKPVAIKRLLPELANDAVFVTRLISEAKLLVGMAHGNIVSVLDLARDGDDVFLVMELIDGPTLRQLIKARGARGLSLGIATYIVQSAAAGLEFAHARPGGAIIHADISPSNLLLTTSGEVRVSDFGIARREGRVDGVIEGKWAYMAPEQARGEALTPRSDVFALGVVLYELITGQHPLGHKITADEREHTPVRVIPPRVVRPSVPPGLDAICMRALAHDPRDRFARMQHVIDALVEERFANGWREGASDLATVIRESVPSSALPEVRTQVTDRPLTIVTRSLISASQHQTASVSQSASGPAAYPRSGATAATVPGRPADTARSASSVPTGVPAPAAAAMPFELAQLQVPAEALARLSAALLPGNELASVVGGAKLAGNPQRAPARERGQRWTFAVLGIAALVGVTAAIAIQLAPDGLSPRAEAAPPARVVIAAPVPPAPTAVVAPAPPPAPAQATPAAAPAASPPPVAAGSVAAAAPAASPTAPTGPVAAAAPATPPPAPEAHAAARAPTELGDRPTHGDPGRHSAAPPARHRAHRAVAHHASAAEATLRVLTYNGVWANVSVIDDQQGRDIQHADVQHALFKLPPGGYTVRLAHEGLPGRRCVVHLEPGEALKLKVDMQEGACDHY